MSQKKHQPFVPENMKMTEFTVRAVLIGLVLTIVLGAANAYLGLRAGITIAATYPAAVISIAVLRLFKASVLEENIARTAGSIGESVAAGAIFTIPAFVISKSWASFNPGEAYWKSTVLMVTGSILGVLFVSLMRRVMVEDPELPFPESVAAAEIHKAGQRAGESAKLLGWNMLVGGVIYLLGAMKLFVVNHEYAMKIGELGKSVVRLGGDRTIAVGAASKFAGPDISPAYVGVGYIIGPKLAALNFAGGVLAWGLMVPLLLFFMGPSLQQYVPAGSGPEGWDGMATAVWRFIVRPIAVGGMLVGAANTLFKMRKSIVGGLGRAFSELGGETVSQENLSRTERYMSAKVVFALIGIMFLAMLVLYINLSGNVLIGAVAAVVMIVVGFFFATVSGSLVGLIGSTNNPISGLTLSTLIIAALLMVSLGATGVSGVATVLGVAAVVCVSSAVAGELLQDFKAGYILGGTPRSIQIVELIAVVVASLVMYFPLLVLHQGNINAGGTGFGDPKLSAPQAGLMALLAQGIVGGDMPWPLVVVGMMMGIGMIMSQVKSPMLVAVGMYLPLGTTFAIFVGGVIRWITDGRAARAGMNEGQRIRIENAGILVASGLIAGEALMGLVDATIRFFDRSLPELLATPSYSVGLLVLAAMAALLIIVPMKYAGSPDEPPPPQAMM
ncbi:MAG: oligopeptide transporter, OPT family [Acidobacteriota bacterium]